MSLRSLAPRTPTPRPGRFWRSRGGNVAIITALMMFPLTFALGMGIDYTFAKRRQDQMNGIADAAALAGVTPSRMTQATSVSQTAALNMFTAQLATVSGVTYSPSNLRVTAVDVVSASTVQRTVTVTYSAASQNIFSSLLGMTTLPVSGSASATSNVAPNIDFYVMLDSSPSMEIAATQAGINTMVANTASQGGCAFGCHETHPAADNLGNPGGEDNYALARNLGVTLRIDLVNLATQNLMTYAQTTSVQNNAAYRAAIYTIDYNFNTLQSLTNNLNTAKASAANINAVTVYDNNCLTQANCNSDEDSYLDFGLAGVNGAMPTPGNGSKNAGDTPQEVLFIVSDGVVDQLLGGSRVMAPINTRANWCTTIKNRGIRIAFLYTTYNPLPTNAFYNGNIAPFQSQIATEAQNCASPGLFFQVSTGGDISAAMTLLFQKAVATARLTQ